MLSSLLEWLFLLEKVVEVKLWIVFVDAVVDGRSSLDDNVIKWWRVSVFVQARHVPCHRTRKCVLLKTFIALKNLKINVIQLLSLKRLKIQFNWIKWIENLKLKIKFHRIIKWYRDAIRKYLTYVLLCSRSNDCLHHNYVNMFF